MNYQINFQKVTRNFMALTFDDEKEDGTPYVRKILVGMPKKRVFDALMDLRKAMKQSEENVSEAEKEERDKQSVDNLYLLTAEILSNNINKEKIDKKWVEEQMDIEQIGEFLKEYVKFCNREAANPN